MSIPFFELGRNPGSVCFILELGLQKHHGLRRRKLKKTYYHYHYRPSQGCNLVRGCFNRFLNLSILLPLLKHAEASVVGVLSPFAPIMATVEASQPLFTRPCLVTSRDNLGRIFFSRHMLHGNQALSCQCISAILRMFLANICATLI